MRQLLLVFSLQSRKSQVYYNAAGFRKCLRKYKNSEEAFWLQVWYNISRCM